MPLLCHGVRCSQGHCCQPDQVVSARPCCSVTWRSSIRKRRSLHELAQEIAALAGASFGFLGEAANSVGGLSGGACPSPPGLNAKAMLDTRARPMFCSASSRNSIATIRAGNEGSASADWWLHCRPTRIKRSTTPMCCCRLRLSPRPPAPSSIPKAACKALMPRPNRWAKPARPGKCCACWATCWSWLDSITTAAKRCAPKRWMADIAPPVGQRA